MAFDATPTSYLIALHPDVQATLDRDMACEALCGGEPWTAEDEDAAERRDHFIDSARDWDMVDDACAPGAAW